MSENLLDFQIDRVVWICRHGINHQRITHCHAFHRDQVQEIWLTVPCVPECICILHLIPSILRFPFSTWDKKTKAGLSQMMLSKKNQRIEHWCLLGSSWCILYLKGNGNKMLKQSLTCNTWICFIPCCNKGVSSSQKRCMNCKSSPFYCSTQGRPWSPNDP